MQYLILDVETTIKHIGTKDATASAFCPENKLCIVSWATETASGVEKIDYDDEPYSDAIANIQRLVDSSDCLVGFNFKFDLHWLRRYGISFGSKRIWDCQLAAFILSRQSEIFPSLNDELSRYNLGNKLDFIHDKYWSLGVNTDAIPFDELAEYGEKDAQLTRSLFLRQSELVRQESRAFRSLVSLGNSDLLVTAEMEWNGIPLDVATCLEKADEVTKEIGSIDSQLNGFFQCDWANYDSGQQLSVLLFGGELERVWREQVGVYKSGKKIGAPRYAVRREPRTFPRLVEPPKGSQLASGHYSTSADNLSSLKSSDKRTRQILLLLLHRSKLEQLRGTYYSGLPELMSTMGWTDGVLHGQINHCIVRTGRTSSSKPNLQNHPPEIDALIRSRFEGGKVVQFDAKGLEWVGIVYLAQDPVGMDEIWKGVDQHLANQERFGLPDKRTAKFFVFRLIYGGNAWTYANDSDFTHVSKKESFWQNVMDQFYEKYKGIARTHVGWERLVAEGNELVTPTGRKFRFYPKPNGDWPRTQILNYPVQSLGADLMAIARVSLFRRMKAAGLRSVLINTIHDSIVVDIYPGEWYTVNTMLNEVFADIPKNFEKLFGVPFNLPMRCEVKYLNEEENK